MINRLILVSVFMMLTSCVGFNFPEPSCTQADLEQAGLDDGRNGSNFNRSLIDHCSTKMGTVTTKDIYSKGYTQGIVKFCTHEFGLYWGRSGKDYSNTCPSQMENAFLAGYSAGKMEYDKLQVEKQNAQALQSIAGNPGLNNFPPAKGCFSSFDCEVEDKCIQDPKSNFGTDRLCQQRPYKDCFSDRDCKIKGECKDRLCNYKK